MFDLDEVYRGTVEQVARWVRRLAGPELDVEDLVQEVLVVVHRRLHEFRGDAKLTTWLYRITERVVIDRRRMERRRRWLRGLFGGLPPPPPEDPSVLAERRQMERVLYRMLEDLPERSRTLILLFEVEGLSGEEIAELMDLPLRSLWVYLHRARAALRRCVESLDVDTGAVWERAAAGRRP